MNPILIYPFLFLLTLEIVEIERKIVSGELVHYTYGQLFQEIRKEYPLKGSTLQADGSAEMEKPVVSEPIEYEKLLVQSKKEKKPRLLFFTGFACVNALKMQASVLSDNTIVKTIKENFIFKQFYVDNKTTLAQEVLLTSLTHQLDHP